MISNLFNLTVDPQIVVRTLHPDDAEELFQLLERNRPHLRPWMHKSVLPETAQATRKFTIECFLNSLGDPMEAVDSPYFDELGQYFAPPDPIMEMGVWVRNHLVGSITLSWSEDGQSAAEFGYWLTWEREGNGIITRCISALMDYAIDNMNVERFVIRCASENQRSRAVAERLGYRLQSTIPNGEVIGEYVYDLLVYGILSTEWHKRKTATIRDE